MEPKGTLTFLFSDIEGSTHRWERDRAAMADAVQHHDVILRSAIETHRGYVFKTVGDAFCAVFPTASDALLSALDGQRGVAAADFAAVDGVRVRMGLHTGHADERDGDYFGPAVNRVARLMSIGHGGQVLLSGVTADVLRDERPPDCELIDLGAHRLKDLNEPERVYQLAAAGLQQRFPALLSIDGHPNNLPPQLTSFIGRDDALLEIADLTLRTPLVTLAGTGGVGKTRLALQTGAKLLERVRDGVWFIEFAATADPALLEAVIAHTLGIQETPNRPLLQTLLAYLKRKKLMLILDNCEHVIVRCREIIAALLHECPEVRVIATSREALNIAGESVYRMPSLMVPPPDRTTTAHEMTQYGAVALFADRAKAARAAFELTDANAPLVAQICRRLDGIPLAIELAAARVNMLSLDQLTRKLDDRFRVLTGGDRSALPRQQTMRALIDWSYNLLGEPEQALFRKLSVFAGGFTLEPAAEVCADESTPEDDVCDLLGSLVDKSLVVVDVAGSEARFRLLESTRQYARERVSERGESAELARKHATAYLRLAERLDNDWYTIPETAWMAQVRPEMDNWRAALDWALTARGDVLMGVRLTSAIRWWYIAQAEGRYRVSSALAAVEDAMPAEVRAKLYCVEAKLDMDVQRYASSRDAAQRALLLYREIGDPLGLAECLRTAGASLVFEGDLDQGAGLLEEALAAARELRVAKLVGQVLQALGLARNAAGDETAARELYSEALAIFKATGAQRASAIAALSLAEGEFRAGDAEAALRLAEQTLTLDLGYDQTGVAISLCNMAAYSVALGRYEKARELAHEALTRSRDLQVKTNDAFAVQHLAAAAALNPRDDGERVRAAQLFGYVDARLSALEGIREFTEQQEYDKVLCVLRETLEDARVKALMDEGSHWTEEEALVQAGC